MSITPEAIQRLNVLRAKVIDNTATKEELMEGIKLMRADRMTAQAASETSKRKSVKAAIPKASDLLSELEGL